MDRRASFGGAGGRHAGNVDEKRQKDPHSAVVYDLSHLDREQRLLPFLRRDFLRSLQHPVGGDLYASFPKNGIRSELNVLRRFALLRAAFFANKCEIV